MRNQKHYKRPYSHTSAYRPTSTARPVPPRSKLHNVASISAKIATALVIVLIVIVGISFWLNYHFSPKPTITRELPRIAKDYYENYYYGKLTNDSYGIDLEFFQESEEKGISAVKVRQLLLYGNGKYSEYIDDFNALGCNENTSTVTYFPISPYGRTDYRIEYNLRCTEDIEL